MTEAASSVAGDALAQELTAQLLGRLNSASEDDPTAVLDDQALAIGQKLWTAVGGAARPLPPEVVAVLGAFHWARYLRLPQDTDSADLETAILFFGWLSESHPEVVPKRIEALNEATKAAQGVPARMIERATGLLERAKEERGEPALVDTAVDIVRRVRLAVPEDHPARRSVQELLAGALFARFRRTRRPVDLHAAVDTGRSSVPPEGAKDVGPHRMARSNLGVALSARFEETGELADLTEAVELARTAVAGCDEADPSLGMFLSNLSADACRLYTVTGDPAMLEESAVAARRAVLRSSGSAFRDSLSPLNNLASVLKWRFELFGRRSDLDEAIDITGRAVHLCPPDHPNRPTLLANQVYLLASRSAPGDLDAAIDLGRFVLDIAPVGHPVRPQAAANLGLALRKRHTLNKHVGDLDDGIALEREALGALSPEHPRRMALSSNIAHGLTTRFELQGTRSDLEEAFSLAGAAVAATAEGDPARTWRMQNLARVLETRSRADPGTGRDATEALRLWDESSRLATSPVWPRVQSAVRGGMWAMTEAGGPEPALGCYAQAVGLLDRLAWRGLDRPDRERALAECSGVAAEAVAVALSCRDAEAGIRLAEQGRAVLWSQLLDGRTGFAELRERAPELVDRLARISAELG
ncbi:hypothetical protein GCM10010306_103370 [Streptomyces umbrinus]|uniref:tetratricopeptide repeat protein n=1 Tax=Streptomyces umbrinus TaxID=67370 RepID=UPI00167AEEBC|nr:tetratricopeptide repeat protein [Streptomyces umbrinus]GHB91540.1 hypothetical protein GCM10010306_103370 [Streptomyces umbrinus]